MFFASIVTVPFKLKSKEPSLFIKISAFEDTPESSVRFPEYLLPLYSFYIPSSEPVTFNILQLTENRLKVNKINKSLKMFLFIEPS